MDIKKYIETLESTHNKSCVERKSFKTIKEKSKNVITELSFYESFIPEFFSSNGDADNIRQIYKHINDNVLMQENVVGIVDVNAATHYYDDYCNGMRKFTNDVIIYATKNGAMTESAECTEIGEKITGAITNDPKFIESLFGGSNNQKQNLKISDAMTTIESMIDFIPQLASYKTDCTIFVEKAEESNTYGNMLVNDTLDLFFESVSSYCVNTLKSIIESYQDINNALYPKESTNTPEYKLFG